MDCFYAQAEFRLNFKFLALNSALFDKKDELKR